MNKTFSLLTLTTLLHLSSSIPSIAQGRLDRPFFFREGQEQMEREVQRLQQSSSSTSAHPIEHPSQLLTIDEGQLRWQKYLFQQGNFSIWMPQGVQSEDKVTLNATLGDIDFEVFASHPNVAKFPKSRFIAAYSSVINSSQLSNEPALLNSIQEAIVEKTSFKLVSTNPIQFEQFNGLELVMKADSELIIFKVYLIQKRVYVLAVGQQNQETISTEANSFFDSFRLLK